MSLFKAFKEPKELRPDAFLMCGFLLLIVVNSFLSKKVCYAVGAGSADTLYAIHIVMLLGVFVFAVLVLLQQAAMLVLSLVRRNHGVLAARLATFAVCLMMCGVAVKSIRYDSSELLAGFTNAIEANADLDEIRAWATGVASAEKNRVEGASFAEVDISSARPACLSHFGPANVHMFVTASEQYLLSISFGGGGILPSYGIDIVSPGVTVELIEKATSSLAHRYGYRVKPGVYVWRAYE